MKALRIINFLVCFIKFDVTAGLDKPTCLLVGVLENEISGLYGMSFDLLSIIANKLDENSLFNLIDEWDRVKRTDALYQHIISEMWNGILGSFDLRADLKLSL
jgi:hypothetical protein